MPISHRYKFIYIHVPRCAGTSITDALKNGKVTLRLEGRASDREKKEFNEYWLHHFKATHVKELVGDLAWEAYFKFAFTRNPWDRIVSTYFHHMKRMKDPSFRSSRPEIAARLKGVKTFDEYLAVQRIEAASELLIGVNNQIIMDFVGRYEYLERDFAHICETIGIRCRLQHLNGTTHGHYRDYYTPALRDFVAERCRRDIELFGYEF